MPQAWWDAWAEVEKLLAKALEPAEVERRHKEREEEVAARTKLVAWHLNQARKQMVSLEKQAAGGGLAVILSTVPACLLPPLHCRHAPCMLQERCCEPVDAVWSHNWTEGLRNEVTACLQRHLKELPNLACNDDAAREARLADCTEVGCRPCCAATTGCCTHISHAHSATA